MSSIESPIRNKIAKDQRQSFVDQPSNIAYKYPSPDKYQTVPFDKYLTRTYALKISNTNLPRFKPIKKDSDPSPTSYQIDEAMKKT